MDEMIRALAAISFDLHMLDTSDDSDKPGIRAQLSTELANLASLVEADDMAQMFRFGQYAEKVRTP